MRKRLLAALWACASSGPACLIAAMTLGYASAVQEGLPVNSPAMLWSLAGGAALASIGAALAWHEAITAVGQPSRR